MRGTGQPRSQRLGSGLFSVRFIQTLDQKWTWRTLLISDYPNQASSNPATWAQGRDQTSIRVYYSARESLLFNWVPLLSNSNPLLSTFRRGLILYWPGSGSSKSDRLNRVSEINHLDFWSSKLHAFKRKGTRVVRLVFNIAMRAFW